MNHETWDDGCRRGIFGLVLSILVFTALAFAGVGAWFLVVQALTIGVLALWTVRLWVSPKPQFLCPPIIWPVLAFALYAIGRYLLCDIEYVGRQELLQVLVYSFLFLAILNNAYHQDMILTFSFTLIAVAMAASSYAVFQYVTHAQHIWWVASSEPGRASGPFFSADHFCGYLEMLLPMVVALILVGRIQPLTRILLGYCLVVMLAGVGVTFSRGGWIAATVGLLVVLGILLGHRHHRKFAALTLVLLAGGITAAGAAWFTRTTAFHNHLVSSEGGVNLDIYMRLQVWAAARRMWLDHFWWGVGPGHFNDCFNEYRPAIVQLRAGWVHSDYLNVLTDWGLAGGLLVLAALVLLAHGIIRTWPRVRRSENDFGSGMSNRFACFLGLLGALAAIAVHSLAEFNMHVPADALLALTLLALLTSYLRFATERYWQNVRLPLKLAVSLILAAGMGFLGWQTWRLGQETFWLVRAGKLPTYSLPQAAARERAFACEPMDFANAYAIGEDYRNSAYDATNSAELTTTALGWFQQCQKLNPHFSLGYLREGISLDSLGHSDEAAPCFDAADRHDPNGYFTAANIGWHYLQRGEYAAARLWLVRSLQLQSKNPSAQTCLATVTQTLADRAGD
jgi:O-antigen ligase